ncbi:MULTISPECIES: hypothetical protein [Fusobacterium]|uniref:Uncharacterized protein n=1 Tax=Fusobacterium nucleatum TaxID=851 RepID=A0A133NQS6_FUSNU|nr:MULTISPECIES: hypothetical protein [Fusobacterium]EUB31024.1 hypothetical protein HMPREF1501_2469 [Fusobacterium sp. OBRC1]KXA18650.1 hypothetical protein HMPREF3221_01701 [Fusobacterium nucleatum]
MQEKTFKQLLMSSNYYTLNKQIVKELGIESAFLLTILIEASDGLADEEGWFYQTIEKIGELTGIGRHKQDKIIKELIELKILEQKNKGVPCKRYFKVNYQMIENLVFQNQQTSLSKNDKLDCKKSANWIAENSQTSLSENDNNKEYIINNLNKELNHKEHNKSYDCSEDLKAIKKWFKENKIDFSKKHETKIIELLKNNSLEYLLKLFQEQLDILKNKPGVKNIAGIFSNHLFKGSCEVNLKEIENREIKQKKLKNEEKKESEKNEKFLKIFWELPLEEQEKIETEILKNNKINHFLGLKKNSTVMYYRLIAPFISKYIQEKN